MSGVVTDGNEAEATPAGTALSVLKWNALNKGAREGRPSKFAGGLSLPVDLYYGKQAN